jgi:hypothetical protein
MNVRIAKRMQRIVKRNKRLTDVLLTTKELVELYARQQFGNKKDN